VAFESDFHKKTFRCVIGLRGTAVCFGFWLHVLDYAVYSAFGVHVKLCYRIVSIACHRCAVARTPPIAVVLNPISSLYLIPFFDSSSPLSLSLSLTCSVPTQ